SHKGINIPDTHLADATFTKKDKEDALFALKENVDFLALSFVRNKQDLMPALALIKKINPRVKIIAKIEKNEAIENLEEIIEAADAVMVARGDLAIETAASHVPLLQERIISLCRQQKKPVIVATQMLESMIENPRPTRAETSDVANAVMNQVDGVMLSAESASGKYPVEAVAMMNEIIMSVEASHEFKHYIKIQWKGIPHVELTVNAIASSASTLAYHLAAPAIAVATASGRTAQIISSFRPSAHLIAATHDRDTANQLSLTWGVYPILVKRAANSDLFLKKIIDAIRAQKLVSRGNKIVVMGGTRVGVSGATDTIKVVAL
ncbi:MAG: pyruvate kinase, partial [Candidatus Sungbacteria bacterium]|nr:pyruvate kinase [Candidatus Sungbacteria bacterium]